MADCPIIYCVYREGPATVLASQVLGPLRRLASAGRDVRLCAHVPVGQMLRREGSRPWRTALESLPAEVRRHVTRIPSAPNRARKLWPDGPLFRAWLRRTVSRDQRFVLHCRGTAMTLLADRARTGFPHARLIYDCRGAERAEFLYERGLEGRDDLSPEIRRQADELERAQIDAARAADAIVCVSDRMADFLVAASGVARGKITVIPCCVDVEQFSLSQHVRDDVRRELGLESRFVVTYSGSLRRWQQPERCVDLFQVMQRIEPRAHLLMLTTQPAATSRLIEQKPLAAEDVTIRSVPHTDVPRYLAASDLALLFREDSLVNRVASPVKFGEYLASGTPVVLSEGIGDYSSLADAEDLGLVISQGESEIETEARLGGLIRAVEDDRAGWRKRCRQVAKEQLSAELHRMRIEAVYDQLTGESPRLAPCEHSSHAAAPQTVNEVIAVERQTA